MGFGGSRQVQLPAPLVARTTNEPSLEDILEDSVERPPEPPPWGLIGGWELSTKSDSSFLVTSWLWLAYYLFELFDSLVSGGLLSVPFAIICCAMLLNKLGVFREAIEPLFHSSKAGSDQCGPMTPGNLR